MTTRIRPSQPALTITIALVTLAALTTVILLAAAPDAHAALTGFSGEGKGKGGFAKLFDFFDKLGKGLIPLSIPLGVLGLVGAGVMFLMGSQRAGAVIAGVVGGLALILFGPSIIA